MNFLKRLLGKKKAPIQREFSGEELEIDYELKMKGLEAVLGKSHDLVGHAIIPYSVGGSVHMYYFPNHIPGTGFATMDLLDPEGHGPRKNRLGTYELVAFTKHDYNRGEEGQTPFNLMEREACGYFTTLGRYSTEAVLNPNETIELPNGEGEETSCMVLDLYEPDGKKFMIGDRSHHLILCLRVHRSEMEYARANGTVQLLDKLKEKGHYPYSSLDREAVV